MLTDAEAFEDALYEYDVLPAGGAEMTHLPLTDAELAEIERQYATILPDAEITRFETFDDRATHWAVRVDGRLMCTIVVAPSLDCAARQFEAVACLFLAPIVVPRLIAELRRLRTELDQAEGEASGWQSRYDRLLEDKVKAYYDLRAANAEIDRLRGMRCETCGEWCKESPFVEFCVGLGVHTAPEFGCNRWRARL